MSRLVTPYHSDIEGKKAYLIIEKESNQIIGSVKLTPEELEQIYKVLKNE